MSGGEPTAMGDLTALFNPRSVAVVGASSDEGKMGYMILRNLIDSGYKGQIYPVNPKAEQIGGHKCYPSVPDIPERDIDLAVLVIPVSRVLDTVEQCGQAGVKNLVMITAGFKEIGHEGAVREKKFIELCEKYGMNAVGPNCMGLADTHTPMNVSFAATAPIKGDIAFVSQSGALCVAILDWCIDKDIGFSQFISLGNKAVLNEADFILHAANDPNTKVIMCYIEDVSNGAQFLKAAREASVTTPVIILKAGVSEAGAMAASSHTGALAGSDRAYETAFRQCGVIRARAMEELFDLALAFATQPIPAGDSVAVVTNSGGPGIIATDKAEATGLRVARFQKETIDRLRERLPEECSIYNPVDLIAGADGERYEFAMDTVMSDPGVDSLVVLLTPVTAGLPDEVSDAVTRVRAKYPDKPVVASFTGGGLVAKGARDLYANGTPTYQFPEPAMGAIAGLSDYSKMRRKLQSHRPLQVDGVCPDRVEPILRAVRDDNRVVLLGNEAARVVEAYGITVARSHLAREAVQAREFAERLGFPVVLKVASPKILHKTDIGGVRVGLNTPEEVEMAFVDILENVHNYFRHLIVHGVEVQKMMPEGVQTIVGMTRDIQFGPLLAFGLGGIYVNLLRDAAFRLVDGVSRDDIEEMITETKAYVLLRGFRGQKAADTETVVDTLCRIARLAADFPEITEMEINPLFAYQQGVSALDVKITIS